MTQVTLLPGNLKITLMCAPRTESNVHTEQVSPHLYMGDSYHLSNAAHGHPALIQTLLHDAALLIAGSTDQFTSVKTAC